MYANVLVVLSLDYFLYSLTANDCFEQFFNLIYKNVIMAGNVFDFILPEHLLCSLLSSRKHYTSFYSAKAIAYLTFSAHPCP